MSRSGLERRSSCRVLLITRWEFFSGQKALSSFITLQNIPKVFNLFLSLKFGCKLIVERDAQMILVLELLETCPSTPDIG